MKPLYFVSDLHLGTRGDEERRARFSSFLTRTRELASGLFILGDLFEFGFEYRGELIARNRAVADELAALVRAGVRVALVKGNHDCWLSARFQQTYGVELLDSPAELTLAGRRVLLAHGDELDRSRRTRWTSALFRSRIATRLYSLLPERLGLALAGMIARMSRSGGIKPALIRAGRGYAEAKLREGYDLVVMGHVHVPACERFGAGWYVNTGDWIKHFTYGTMDAQGVELVHFGSREVTGLETATP